MFKARVLASKSLFIRRFVGFLGASVLSRGSNKHLGYAYVYAHGKVFNEGVMCAHQLTDEGLNEFIVPY